MEPEEALHWHILRRKKDGVEDWIDKSVEKIGAVPTLNEVLLPAMKEVGDKFGAGELILPFVLQSAEVMKRAVAQLENYLERIEGHTKGKVVIATVFGDVHDIGKSLVNTILTNNGYTVVDLGKQVPVDTIISAAQEHDATAIGLSALLVSTSKQMPLCVQELHQRGLEYPVLVGGAAINRDFGRRILYPHGKESDDVYEPGVFYCKDAFQGLDTMDQLVEPRGARGARREDARRGAEAAREARGQWTTRRRSTDDSVRSSARTDTPIPEPPFWGVREVEVDLDEVFPYLDRHVLFKLHWGGRGKKGEEWRKLLEGDGEDEGFVPKLERMWREQDYIEPRAKLGYFPCNADGNELVIFDPESPDTEIERLVFPRQPKHDRICLTDFFRPLDSGERDVVALQGGDRWAPSPPSCSRSSRPTGEFSEQLFVHGLAVQAAEGMAEWLHAEVRRGLEIDLDQGRRYSWGYPACPDQSEHEKVWRLLDLEEIGMTLSGGYAVMPEQSTVADRGAPPAGGLLRHEVRLHPEGEGTRRADRRHRARRRAAAGGRAARTARSRKRPSPHSAASIASRNDSIPNEPSSRAATLPDRSIVKSHGSVGSPNAWRGSRRPFSRIVVVVDLLVDELHLVPVLLLELRGDVHDRPADARLAELRRRHQQRDRLLADDLVEADVVHVVDRLAGAGHFLDPAKRGERVGLHVRSLLADGDDRILLPNGDAGGGPELLPSDVRDREDRGLAGLLERDLGPVDRGDRVRLGSRVLTAELALGHERVGGREEGPLRLVLRAWAPRRPPSSRRSACSGRRSARTPGGSARPRTPSSRVRSGRRPGSSSRAPAATCPRARGSPASAARRRRRARS